MNTIGYFEIQTDNIIRAVGFYSKVFGWKFTKDDSLPVEYWRIDAYGLNGGLLLRPVPPPSPSGTNAFVCSVQATNFDAISKLILEYGGQIAMEKFAVSGKCWQGYFLDTEGNTFGLFQVDEKAK
jgi:uncharacterized protein